MESYYFAMFHSHWYWSSANGDIRYLICHVISQKHVIEESSDIVNGSSSWYVTTLPSLVVVGNICF